MFKSGNFISDYVEKKEEGEEIEEKQIQPNGVDLTVDKIYKLKGSAFLGDEEYEKQERVEAYKNSSSKEDVVTEDDVDSLDNIDEWFELPRGAYVIEYGEIIEIPEAHVGFVLPRSRVNRCGAHLTTAVWDQGYKGKGEGCLMTSTVLGIECDMRIGQLVMCNAHSAESTYGGSHQGENI